MRNLWTPALVAKFRIFRTDSSGVAAIEFGLLAPLLLMMTFGTIELSRALIVHKRFQRATSMVGDLVTREKQLWPKDIADADVTTQDAKDSLAGIMKSVTHAMEPFSTTPLTLRVYQVLGSPTATDPNKNTTTNTRIEWSYEYPSGTTEGCGNKESIDSGLVAPNGRTVFVTATYHYTPILGNLLPHVISTMTWTDTMVMTPRDVPSVMFLPGLNNGVDWDKTSQNPNPCQ